MLCTRVSPHTVCTHSRVTVMHAADKQSVRASKQKAQHKRQTGRHDEADRQRGCNVCVKTCHIYIYIYTCIHMSAHEKRVRHVYACLDVYAERTQQIGQHNEADTQTECKHITLSHTHTHTHAHTHTQHIAHTHTHNTLTTHTHTHTHTHTMNLANLVGARSMKGCLLMHDPQQTIQIFFQEWWHIAHVLRP